MTTNYTLEKLTELTTRNLREIASNYGVTNYSRMKKPELVKAIFEAAKNRVESIKENKPDEAIVKPIYRQEDPRGSVFTDFRSPEEKAHMSAAHKEVYGDYFPNRSLLFKNFGPCKPAAKSGTKVPDPKKGGKKKSLRNAISECLLEGIWDRTSIVEYLDFADFENKKNHRRYVSMVMSQMRNWYGWDVVEYQTGLDAGRICVNTNQK